MAEEDENSRFKLAQLYHSVKLTHNLWRKSYSHNRVINEILKDDFNVNCKVTINLDYTYLSKGFDTYLQDFTALHFLFYQVQDIETFATLLERGADLCTKNGNGQTALHLMMAEYTLGDSAIVRKFMKLVLSAQVKRQNCNNPHDDVGMSHLHGACIANHGEAVELFLNNGASVDEAVSRDAPDFAGYTPLHFAAESHSFRVARILLNRGASVNAPNALGSSPLDLAVGDTLGRGISQEAIAERERTLKLLLENGATSADGMSSFQGACTLKDLTVAQRLLDEGAAELDYTVPMTSVDWPGYTALHIAAYNDIEAVKLLLRHGAKMDVVNAHRPSPLQICLDQYGLQDVNELVSCIANGKDIRLSDAETSLQELIAAMRDLEQFKLFTRHRMKDTSAIVPRDSPLWPGCTLLHLAVALSKNKAIVNECLSHGLAVNVQDVEGQTAIHLAFNQGKVDIAKLLLKHLERLGQLVDCVDANNLSYLHVACAIKDSSLVEQLLSVTDPNVAYVGKTRYSSGKLRAGSRPLHIVAADGSRAIAETLLRRGADLRATDDAGLTPVHRLLGCFSRPDQRIANVVFDSLLANPQDCASDELGLSYLHIACFFGHAEAAEELLDRGSNVNGLVKCDERSANLYACYENFSPLQMAIVGGNSSDEVLDLLLRRGADVFLAETSNCSKRSSCIPVQSVHVVRRFCHVLWERADMQRRMQQRFGLTRLHIACYMKNKKAIQSALNDHADVNARVRADSVMFAGCTALHLLLTVTVSENERQFDIEFPEFTVERLVSLLVARGADVTIANSQKDTPIHVFHREQGYFFDGDRCRGLLLKSQRDFNVNPTNAEGLSHFHLACLWRKPKVVGKFLRHGSLDISRPVDYFARSNAGCSALHLAVSDEMRESNGDWTGLSETLDLLLMHGADVAAKDVCGDTPLHRLASLRSLQLYMCILDKFVTYGGDMQCRNIQGQTPIEKLADILNHDNPFENITIFQKYDYNINSWNHLTGDGYVANIFLKFDDRNLSDSFEFDKFAKSPDVRIIDDMGRTVIHNSVALSKTDIWPGKVGNYIYAIESFIKIGIDIDYQDKSGQTALHYAARMENTTGVKALLACGADVNIVDSTGKTAFTYAVEHSNNKCDLHDALEANATIVLRSHMKKLLHLRIEVSQLNRNLLQEVQHFFRDPIRFGDEDSNRRSHKFFSQIELTKTLYIGTNSLTVFDFLPETGAVNLYSLLLKPERHQVDDFFKSINYNQLKKLTGIIKLQLKKMTTRFGLIDSAYDSLRTHLRFSVPGLCEQISQYLLNSDLKNLIESSRLEMEKESDVPQ